MVREVDTETVVSHIYFLTIGRIPKKVNGVRILKGIEANIINEKGDIDVDNKVVERLDYVMANFHKETAYHNKGIEFNTGRW